MMVLDKSPNVLLDRRCHSRIGIGDGRAVASLHLPTLPDQQGQK